MQTLETKNITNGRWVNVQQDRTELFYFDATSTPLSLKRMKSKNPQGIAMPKE